MFNFDKTDLQRFAVSSVGAVALSAACILGVSAPVRAATPNAPVTVADWQGAVERQIDSGMDAYSLRMDAGKPVETVLALRFTAEGDYAGATVAKSSGKASLDAHAIKVARQVSYPALPAGYRGQPQTVAMRLVFGLARDGAEASAMQDRPNAIVQIASAKIGNGTQVASK